MELEYIVEAEFYLLPGNISGRTKSIRSGYRPNHNFGSADNREMYIGEITIPDTQALNPGESAVVTINFYMPESLQIELEPGLEWRIQEAANLVGRAKILRVISKRILI